MLMAVKLGCDFPNIASHVPFIYTEPFSIWKERNIHPLVMKLGCIFSNIVCHLFYII